MATGVALAPGDLALRFCLDPQGVLTADPRGTLPGRGAWIGADRGALLDALAKRRFARSLKTAYALPPDGTTEDFAADVVRLLEIRALSALGIAQKAGLMVHGFDTVHRKAPGLAYYLTPQDAAPDGVAKIRRKLESVGRGAHIVIQTAGERLSDALGRGNAVHVGLLPGGASERAAWEVKRWNGFALATPDSDTPRE